MKTATEVLAERGEVELPRGLLAKAKAYLMREYVKSWLDHETARQRLFGESDYGAASLAGMSVFLRPDLSRFGRRRHAGNATAAGPSAR